MEKTKFKTQMQKARIKNTRTISYRKYGVPAIIIEGKWLKDIYGWNIGDQVNVIYEPGEIKIQKLKLSNWLCPRMAGIEMSG